jgi:pyruvate/2-oxoglutarate/acetoin dehydrogenase E1 component
MIINAIRGIHVLVPRNMTKAAGFYNSFRMWWTALVIECLKWISLKREKPLNYGEFKTPIGVVETMKEGADITLVSMVQH